MIYVQTDGPGGPGTEGQARLVDDKTGLTVARGKLVVAYPPEGIPEGVKMTLPVSFVTGD